MAQENYIFKVYIWTEKINSGTITLNSKYLNKNNIFVKPQERKIGFFFQDYPLFPFKFRRKHYV